ncbi:hypothetical protein AB0K60_34820 [Thermopolyspora sp. NPDC052614]|uniref:hypothetical protein n=1 Tax=Thermopolyspora sp. NPDC052614 TaxID=3155682 RepID=UPI0034129EAF
MAKICIELPNSLVATGTCGTFNVPPVPGWDRPKGHYQNLCVDFDAKRFWIEKGREVTC